MEKKNIELSIRELLPFQEDFPKRLREIPDSPECLYLKGFLPKEGEHTVGIIGARDGTEYGKDIQGLSRKLWQKKE
jgi:SMF family DNA processing protein